MLRVAAALLCVAAGQVVAWAIYPADTTGSPLWPFAETAAAAALVTMTVRRWRAAETER